MLRKDCMTVKDRRIHEILSVAKLSEKTPVLLRFASKNGMDFNEISTDFSTPKLAISPLKMRQNSHRNGLKNSFFGSRSCPIMSSIPQPVIQRSPYKTRIESEISLVPPYR